MRIVCFGDILGIPQLLRHIPSGESVAIISAEIRPHYHEKLQKLAQNHNISFFVQPKKTSPNYRVFLQTLQTLSPDLILVNSYSMLLAPEVIAIPRLGALNIHGALLPQYRGCNPIQWALCNNEPETGVTMHYMDSGCDTGDIVAQKKVPICFEDTWIDIRERLGIATEQLLAEEIPKILDGVNIRVPQDASHAHYWQRRKPEAGFFDWSWSSLKIYNLIRALVAPHPGAFYLDSDSSKVTVDRFVPYSQVCEMQHKFIGRVIE